MKQKRAPLKLISQISGQMPLYRHRLNMNTYPFIMNSSLCRLEKAIHSF